MTIVTTTTTESTGGAAVASALMRNGVDTVFGIPGTHNLEIYRYLTRSGLRTVTTRHEQGAGFAADGYARASGRPGVLVTTSGPGLTNATTAIATAYADSVPLLAISPGPPRGAERTDSGRLHTLKDQRAHVDAITQRSVRVDSADEAMLAITEAFAGWRTERPRPIHVEIPIDVLEGPWEGEAPVTPVTATRRPDPGTVAQAARFLTGAERPIIIAGGGSVRAAGPLRRLAEALGAPVITTAGGKGVLAETHPLSIGAAISLVPAQEALKTADVVLVVGSELGESDLWGGVLETPGTTIRIDVDPRQLHKNIRADLPVLGDAEQVLGGLAAAVPARASYDGVEWAGRLRTECGRAASGLGHPWRRVNRLLSSCLPSDTIVAGDSAPVCYYGTLHYWRMEGPRNFLFPTGYGPLGYALPAAIGAKLAQPERAVVALGGDGGFLVTAQELTTAASLGLNLPVIVVNNNGFGELREEMGERGITPVGVDIDGVDLPRLASAYGAHGTRLDDIGDLPEAVGKALATNGPTLIEIPLVSPVA